MAGMQNHILLYHRIVPDDCPGLLLDMLGGEMVTQTVFARQLEWLKTRFQVVDLAQLLQSRSPPEHQDNENKVPRAAITFDDGFADNLSMGLPVLQDLGLPATIFMIYGLIGDKRGFHHHEVARYVASEPDSNLFEPFNRIRRPREKLKKIIRYLKELPDSAPAEGFERARAENRADRFLDEGELQQLAASGISIQSHTVSHRPLSQLAGDILNRELVDAKTGLEALIQKPVDFLAYPIGRRDDYNAQSIEAVKQAGYQAAFTALSGVFDQGTNAWEIPRIGVRNSLDDLEGRLKTGTKSRFWGKLLASRRGH